MAFTYTVLSRKKLEDGRLLNHLTLASTAAYTTGGIALSNASLGLPAGVVSEVKVLDSGGDGYIYEWVKSSNKIMMFVESASANHILSEVASSVSPTVALTVSAIGY